MVNLTDESNVGLMGSDLCNLSDCLIKINVSCFEELVFFILKWFE